MKRPPGIAVAFYAAGLLLAGVFQPPVAAPFVISFLVLAGALVFKKLRPVLICLLLTLASWTSLIIHTAVISPDDLRTTAGNETEIVTVRGLLLQTPQLKIFSRDGESAPHSQARVRVAGIRRDENWRPAFGEINVTTPAPLAGDDFTRADENALVLLGRFSGTKVLLLSDLGRGGQSALLSRTNDLRADIVVAGLPDEDEPLCDALLEAVKPRIIVVADSEFPAGRRAGRGLKERLAAKNVPVAYTRDSGAVTIIATPDGWSLAAMDGRHFSNPKRRGIDAAITSATSAICITSAEPPPW
jgi:hypothetical protein